MKAVARPTVALLLATGLIITGATSGCTNRPYASPEEQAQNACKAIGPKALSGALIGGLGGAAAGAAIGGAAGGGRAAGIGAAAGLLTGLVVGLAAGHNIDQRDCAQAQIALAQIRNLPVGTPIAWASSTGSHGTFIPTSDEYAGPNGTFCRNVTQQATLAGHETTSTAVMTCRTADGNYNTISPPMT